MGNSRTTLTREQLFWLKVDRRGSEECWKWTACVMPQTGYGDFCYKRPSRHIGAHRFSWIVNRGPIPPGLHVLHHCDNRLCVNPSHLFLGNNDDNIADMIRKGRGQRSKTGFRGVRKRRYGFEVTRKGSYICSCRSVEDAATCYNFAALELLKDRARYHLPTGYAQDVESWVKEAVCR